MEVIIGGNMKIMKCSDVHSWYANYSLQISEILASNGGCPNNTMCSDCIIGEAGSISKCNPSYAIDLCNKLNKTIRIIK